MRMKRVWLVLGWAMLLGQARLQAQVVVQKQVRMQKKAGTKGVFFNEDSKVIQAQQQSDDQQLAHSQSKIDDLKQDGLDQQNSNSQQDVTNQYDVQKHNGLDQQVDTNTNTNLNTKVDSNIDSKTDDKVDTKTDSKTDSNVDSNVDSKVDSNVDSNADTKTDSKTDDKVESQDDKQNKENQVDGNSDKQGDIQDGNKTNEQKETKKEESNQKEQKDRKQVIRTVLSPKIEDEDNTSTNQQNQQDSQQKQKDTNQQQQYQEQSIEQQEEHMRHEGHGTMNKLKLKKKGRKGCFKLKQDCTSNPYNCEEGLQCLRFCELDGNDCNMYCVVGLDGECQSDEECFSEYCNSNKCSERKKAGESCSKPNECLYFKCEGGKCWQPPLIKKPEGGQKVKGIGGIECEAEYKPPVEPKGLLSPCKDNNECESPEDMVCQDGSCKMKINRYCFVNNERAVCQAVCEGNAICSQLPVLKADWLNEPLKEKNTYNTLVEEYKRMKFSKQQQFQVVFDDFIKLLLNRDSIQQAGNAHNPDGNRYMNNYICKIPVGGECKEAIECTTNKCSNGLCLKKQLNEECEQDYECVTENCYNENKGQKPTCQEPKDTGAACELNNNCRSKLCQPQRVVQDQPPVEIKVAGSKFCDDEKLGLNDLCSDHSQCGENAGIQLRCEYSDVINAFGQNEFGWTMNDMFSRFYSYWKVINYPVNKGKTGDMAIWLNEKSEPFMSQQQIVENMKYGLTKKCKHPRNSECDSDAQCPHRNRCEDGRCRGQLKAVCASDIECDNQKGLVCQMNTDVDDYGFGRSQCQNQNGQARFAKVGQQKQKQVQQLLRNRRSSKMVRRKR